MATQVSPPRWTTQTCYMNSYYFRCVLFFSMLAPANNIFAQNNDCINATVICSDDNIGLNPTGPGADDFADPDNFDGCLSGENQSGWYYFEIQPDAPPGLQLGFIINPDNGAGQDYDFAVFGPDVPCDDLGSPIRCSYAGGGCALCPQTGLGMGATDNSESPGGNGFVALLTVQPGEGYYLLIDNFSNNSTGFSLTWTDSAAPWLNCVNCNADAGTLSATPEPACPGETVTVTATDFFDDPDYTQLLLVADENGDFVDIISGGSGTLTSPICAEFAVYSYNYETAGGSVIPTIGGNISDLDCSLECCDLEEITVSFEDTEDPTFPFAPGDITISCVDLLDPMDDQEWIDNCDGNGFVSGIEVGSADVCNGGTITREWEYTDACGNTGTHVQTITVEAAEPADFINPPADVTISCDAIPTGAGPDLAYTNNAADACEITGMASPIQGGSVDVCGGTITYTWEDTDLCGRPINHMQTITVEPAPEASYLNPPADMTVDCANIPNGPGPVLSYTNGESGVCEIIGTVTPVRGGNADECGGTITYTWDDIDPCGRPITHVQTITVTPVPQAAFLSDPSDMTVDCSNIPTSLPPGLDYTNGESGICDISGTATPVQSGSADECGGTITYTWEYTDDCGRTIFEEQNITVTPAPQAAFIDLPPSAITVSCADAPFAPGPDLEYTNNETGDCEISGFAFATMEGTANECGGTITNTWTFTDDCGRPIEYVQTITVEPATQAAFNNLPQDMVFTCDNLPTGGALDLFYDNGELGTCAIAGFVTPVQDGFFDVCGGTVTYTWEFTDECGRMIDHVQTITVEPGPIPAFIDPPLDITVTCENLPDEASLELAYDNGFMGDCEIFGQVEPIITGFASECGGELTYTWVYTDPCGRDIDHQQVITVEPGPEAVFVDPPPASITVSCSDYAADPAPDLLYDNGVVGQCEIFGFATPLTFGSVDECGGNITHIWSFTDECGRPISYSQNITVEPAADPAFIDPPQNTNVDCNADFPAPPDLDYTNGESGSCAVDGFVPATVTILGPNEQQYDWSFTIPCSGEVITHTQIVSQEAPPDIIPDTNAVTLCVGDSFDLSNIGITDQSGGNPTITFHNASPASAGNQLNDLLVSPDTTTVYYALAMNEAGCTDEVPFTLRIEELPNAGLDGNGTVCFELSDSVALFSYLNGIPDSSGQWLDTDFTGANLTNPNRVNLSGVGAGTYRFTYVVTAASVCPNDTAVVTLELLPAITIVVQDIVCTEDLLAYDLSINGNGFEISTSGGGTLTELGGGQFSLTDIPIANSVQITANNPLDAGCTITTTVSPPDCNCPNVAPPISNGNPTVCFGSPNPTLSVILSDGQTANWYSEPTGGTALLTGSETFTPTETATGVYDYYVESENIIDGCLSAQRTQVSFSIVPNPVGADAQLIACDTDTDGISLFNLTDAESLISTDPGYNFRFFLDANEAINGSSPLPISFFNSTPFSQDLTVEIQNTEGCIAYVDLNLTVNIPPVVVPDVTNESCLGSNDGSVTLDSPDAIRYSLDSMTWFAGPAIFSNLSSGPYVFYGESNQGCVSTGSFSITQGIELSLVTFEVVCDPNGTFSDETDDSYTITFSVENTLGLPGTYTVNDGTTDWGSFPYGSIQTWTVPANGQSFQVTFFDDTFGCNLSQAVGPLNSCSSDCLISIDELTFTCNDNSTDTNPEDDFYDFNLTVSASNGSAAGTFVLLIDGNVTNVFDYGSPVQFTLPATGNNPVIAVQDTEEPSCIAEQIVGPLTSCSGACTLAEIVSNIVCDNANTPTDPTDDTFTFDVVITGTNVAGGWMETTTGTSGDYGETISFGPFLIANGDQSITVADQQNTACPLTFIAPAPAPCSDDCSLNITSLGIDCNDNGTLADLTDDSYTVTITAEVINDATADSFLVFVDGVAFGSFPYLTGSSFTLPADGSSPTIEVRNLGAADCSDFRTLNPLNPCNGVCEITSVISNILCDDGGTNDPSDDTYSFELLVTGENTSASWEIAGLPETYAYGTPEFFGPFPIAAGSLNLRVQDIVNADCGEDLTVAAPAICSPTCSLTVTTFSVVCNDNGTVAQQNDDFYDITVNASAENGGPSGNFVVLVDDNQVGSFVYGVGGSFTLPTDGASPSIVVRDETETGCSVSQTVGPLVPCTDACQIQATFANVICDDAGTGNDSADDTYTFELTITGQNTSGQWQTADGSLTGNYGQTLVVGPLLITGGNASIEVQDQQNPDCLAAITVPVPAACSFCTETVNAGPNAIMDCVDTETSLAGVSSFPGSYTWTRNGVVISTELNTIVSQPGTYVLTATYPNGCVAIDSMMVSSNTEIPRLTQIEIIPERCEGENNGRIVIEEIIGGESPFNYALNGETVNTAGFFTQLAPGDYTILVTDANGCQVDTLITIESGPDLKITEPLFLEVMQGDSGTISVSVSVPEDELSYIQWTPPDQLSCDTCLSTRYVAENSQNYILEVIHENGCIVSTTVQILAIQDLEVYVPNVFSPNGDGTNDLFTVFAGPRVTQIAVLDIYDRWGERVFNAQNIPPNTPELGWDGRLQGKFMNPQVFVYTIEVVLDNGSRETLKGDFVLMR